MILDQALGWLTIDTSSLPISRLTIKPCTLSERKITTLIKMHWCKCVNTTYGKTISQIVDAIAENDHPSHTWDVVGSWMRMMMRVAVTMMKHFMLGYYHCVPKLLKWKIKNENIHMLSYSRKEMWIAHVHLIMEASTNF